MARQAEQGQVAFNTQPTQTLHPCSLWLQNAAAVKEQRLDQKLKPFQPQQLEQREKNRENVGVAGKMTNTSKYFQGVGVGVGSK